MKRCVIIGGAPIADYEKIKEYLRADDYFICCDCGLDHAEGLGITPDLIVGDFDSHEKPETDTETITLPREKADTDTYYAAKEGIKRGFDDFLIIGGAGGRIDHTLANIYLLYFLYEQGKKAVMIDDFSEMEIAGSNPVYVSDDYPYFSLVNIAGKAEGIT
ncbi:MAG: thiamine diphosphokinase, partial [Clostridia bacterium]|nr:thiamine diphosphokinase [Clostridia bacterium]